MITPLAVQQPWQPDTTSKDQTPAYMSGGGKQSQATSTLTPRAPCVKKNDQASSKTLSFPEQLLSLRSLGGLTRGVNNGRTQMHGLDVCL